MTSGNAYQVDPVRWTRTRNAILLVALSSWGACGAGLASGRARFHAAWLVGFAFFVTIALGAMFFVMIQHLTRSAWSVPVRRLMENIMATLPAGALLFVPVALGLPQLYEWTHSREPVIQAKAAYLNPAFFTLRAAAYFALWSLWAWKLYRGSVAQDTQPGRPVTVANWSAPGVLLVVVTGTLASFDWIMSLDPRWYSTIFGVYVLSGGAVAFFAALIVVALALRRAGILRDAITVEHYHDLGKWLFAMIVFWAYIAFCQYLLIWYANIPEETIWFRHRLEGNWSWFAAALLFGHFLVPFLVLLSRAAKRNLAVLGSTAALLLAVHFVDMYWLIMPVFHPHGAHLHWLDLAALAAVGSAFALAFWARMRRAAIAPVGDPQFERGLEFQNV